MMRIGKESDVVVNGKYGGLVCSLWLAAVVPRVANVSSSSNSAAARTCMSTKSTVALIGITVAIGTRTAKPSFALCSRAR